MGPFDICETIGVQIQQVLYSFLSRLFRKQTDVYYFETPHCSFESRLDLLAHLGADDVRLGILGGDWYVYAEHHIGIALRDAEESEENEYLVKSWAVEFVDQLGTG